MNDKKKSYLGSTFPSILAKPPSKNRCIHFLAISDSLQMLWLKMQSLRCMEPCLDETLSRPRFRLGVI